MTKAIVLGGSRGIGKAIANSLKSIEIDVFAASKNDIDTSSLDSVKNLNLEKTIEELKSKLKNQETKQPTESLKLSQDETNSDDEAKKTTTQRPPPKLRGNAQNTFDNIFVNNKKDISYKDVKTMLTQMGTKEIFSTAPTFTNTHTNGSHTQCRFSIKTESGETDNKTITLDAHGGILVQTSTKALKKSLENYPSIQLLLEPFNTKTQQD